MTFEQIECTNLIFQNNCDNHSLILNMIYSMAQVYLGIKLANFIQENNKVELEKCMIMT